MSAFKYFIPSRTKINHETLISMGLGFAFEDNTFDKREIISPIEVFDNKLGCIVTTGDAELGYYPERQTWKRLTSVDHESVFYGWDNASPPKPKDLARKEQVAGRFVKLDDGNEWLIPIAREYAISDGEPIARCALPCKLSLVNGVLEQSGRPLEKHAKLWQIAEEWAMHISTSTVINADHIIAAALAITSNYRICTEQLLEFEAINSTLRKAFDILNTVADLESLGMIVDSIGGSKPQDEDQKKTKTLTE